MAGRAGASVSARGWDWWCMWRRQARDWRRGAAHASSACRRRARALTRSTRRYTRLPATAARVGGIGWRKSGKRTVSIGTYSKTVGRDAVRCSLVKAFCDKDRGTRLQVPRSTVVVTHRNTVTLRSVALSRSPRRQTERIDIAARRGGSEIVRQMCMLYTLSPWRLQWPLSSPARVLNDRAAARSVGAAPRRPTERTRTARAIITIVPSPHHRRRRQTCR